MTEYVIYNPKNEKTLLTSRIVTISMANSNTIEISWVKGVASAIHADNLERFFKRTIVHKGNTSRKYTSKEISKWIIVLWDNKQLVPDFTDSFTVKELTTR